LVISPLLRGRVGEGVVTPLPEGEGPWVRVLLPNITTKMSQRAQVQENSVWCILNI
jgi:hypothetical protein